MTISIVYCNGATLISDSDPTMSSEGIEQIVYPNFSISNKIEFLNTTTRDIFYLWDIANKIYENEVLVGGDLIWKKYQFQQ